MRKDAYYTNMDDFNISAVDLARSRQAGAKIALSAKGVTEEVDRAKNFMLKNSGVFITGDYELVEENAVQRVYHIFFRFDDRLGKRNHNITQIPLTFDRDDPEDIGDLVMLGLENLSNNFNRYDELQATHPCCLITEAEELKGKLGILLLYKPEEIINYEPS